MVIFCGNLNRNIQARYFWNYVLSLDDVDDEEIKKNKYKNYRGS